MATITIESGIPIPPTKHSFGAGGPSKYPFRQMSVGDSFVMSKPLATASASACARGQRIGNGIKFACRKIDANTTRIWRIA